MDEKEVSKELWHLVRLKKDARKHTETRRQINKRIRELKQLKAKAEEVEPEKQSIIDKIVKIRAELGTPIISDLRKFTVAELQNHLTRIKNGSVRL